ncbi:signal peptide peptidase SppA [filamentous cyanobacterium CCP5]|nr:signal peptide peptidase SppA [filamentous cyanobacterium CCP5]
MGQFWKYTLASLTGSLLFFLLLVVLMAMGAVGLVGVLVASVSRSEAPAVPKDSILVYDLGSMITDLEDVPTPTEVLLAGGVANQLTLREAVVAIEAAAEDEAIAALYLRGSEGVGAGLAAQMELRDAIETFKQSEKPVIAYDVSWDEQEYFLASLANTVFMNPFGQMEMNGLFAEVMYQAEALNKIGVGVQVTRAGRYKSAVEPFLRNTMSPEERQQTQRLLEDLWQSMLAGVSEGRAVEAPQLQAIANEEGFLFGEEAQGRQLIDQVVYEDEVIEELRSLTGEGQDKPREDQANFRQISLASYAETVDDPLVTRQAKDQVALVVAEGPIVNGSLGPGGGNVIVGEQVARQLRDLRQDDSVKAVVLRINSPGGSAIASEIILREVRLLQAANKPVVASMGNVAASGGYWIASLADTIVAEPTTITGSIGVFSLFINLEDLGDKVGLSWEGVKTAELADIFSATRPKSDQELEILQESVDRIYDEFLERVVEGRELPPDRVAEIAQGRVWSGKTAQELGLVDEIGGLSRAIEIAAESAKLEDDWQLRLYPEEEEWQRFIGRFLATASTPRQDPLMAQITRLSADLQLVRRLDDPQGIYALMPFNLDLD